MSRSYSIALLLLAVYNYTDAGYVRGGRCGECRLGHGSFALGPLQFALCSDAILGGKHEILNNI